jgi:hypothetical protein
MKSLDIKKLLTEENLTTLEFNVEVPMKFEIDSHSHEENRRKEGRFGEFESQNSVSDYSLIKFFESFKLIIAKLIFMGEIKEREAFVIDSVNYGFGVAVAPFGKSINHWNLHIITIVKHTSFRTHFKVRPGQLVILDGGKYKKA